MGATYKKVNYRNCPRYPLEFLSNFGSWVSRTNNTVYQAATDLLVCAGGTATSVSITGKTDGSNPPTTIRSRFYMPGVVDGIASFTMPVRKNDYWKVEGCNSFVFEISIQTA